jgi:hypothetical protein
MNKHFGGAVKPRRNTIITEGCLGQYNPTLEVTTAFFS